MGLDTYKSMKMLKIKNCNAKNPLKISNGVLENLYQGLVFREFVYNKLSISYFSEAEKNQNTG